MGNYTNNGVTYKGYVVSLGNASPGVVIGTTTTPPTTSASWFINSAGTVGLQTEIFRFSTQVSQRYAFKVQDNPMGPFTYTINLVDGSATPVLQKGQIQLQIWDSALQVNKKTLLTIDSATAATSGTAGTGGAIQNRLPFNFGEPGEMYVTTPGDVIRMFFTQTASGQNGVNATNSSISLYVDQLTQTS
jgi:hypothetical protein